MEHRLFIEEGEVGVSLLDPKNKNEGRGIAMVFGNLDKLRVERLLVRVHSRCLYGDVFNSQACDCGAQLKKSCRELAKRGGILFYLDDQEGRGAGLKMKAHGYHLEQQEGLDTVEAYSRLGLKFDTREYGHCVRFLKAKGIKKITLLSNNPSKERAFSSSGIDTSTEDLVVGINSHNINYMITKRDKAGHRLPTELRVE